MEVSHMNNWVSLETPSEWRKQALINAHNRHNIEREWKKQGKKRQLIPIQVNDGLTRTWKEVWE